MSKAMAQKIAPPADKLTALETQNQLLHQYLEMVKNLYWASQEIASSKNFLYDLNQLLYRVMGVVGAKDGSISRLDFKTNELVFVLVHGELGRQLPDYRIKADTGIAGWVIQHRKPIIVNDPRLDKRFSQIVDSEFGFFTNFHLRAPPRITLDKRFSDFFCLAYRVPFVHIE